MKWQTKKQIAQLSSIHLWLLETAQSAFTFTEDILVNLGRKTSTEPATRTSTYRHLLSMHGIATEPRRVASGHKLPG
jgi:hypothetical protein